MMPRLLVEISSIYTVLPTVFPDVLDKSVRSTQPVGVSTIRCVRVTAFLLRALFVLIFGCFVWLTVTGNRLGVISPLA